LAFSHCNERQLRCVELANWQAKEEDNRSEWNFMMGASKVK